MIFFGFSTPISKRFCITHLRYRDKNEIKTYFINVLCLKSLNNRHSTLTLTTIVYRLLAYQKAVEKGLFRGGLVSRDGPPAPPPYGPIKGVVDDIFLSIIFPYIFKLIPREGGGVDTAASKGFFLEKSSR